MSWPHWDQNVHEVAYEFSFWETLKAGCSKRFASQTCCLELFLSNLSLELVIAIRCNKKVYVKILGTELILKARAEILEKIAWVFWEIWRHQKDILKLTDHYYLSANLTNLNGWSQSCSVSKETTDVTVTRGMLWSKKV